jgi:hypothetical protein
MNRLETLVEKKIREAMKKGEFDHLPGGGQPVDLTSGRRFSARTAQH